MIAIILTICLILGTVTVFGQTLPKKEKEERPVKVSLLGNYYEQDGDHSAVNGGRGSQELYSNELETSVFIPIKDSSAIKVSGGFDYYTSASLLSIDKYQTAASSGINNVSGDELRSFGSVSLELAHKKTNSMFSPSIGFSTEYDVSSFNTGMGWAKKTKYRHGIYSVGTSFIADRWMMVYPGEFRNQVATYTTGASGTTGGNTGASPIYGSGGTSTGSGGTSGGTSGGSTGSGGDSGGIRTGPQQSLSQTKSGSEEGSYSGYEGGTYYGLTPYASVIPVSGKTITKDGNTYPVDYRYSWSLSNQFSFVINKKSNTAFGVDLVLQKGMLSTPFHRVYFNDGLTDDFSKEVRIEKLPTERVKVAAFGRYNLSLHKNVALRTFVRYYVDSWDVQGLTANVDVPIYVYKGLSVSPVYRFYYQLKSKYYAGYGEHEFRQGSFYTSDYDLAGFSSHKVGASLRYAPVNSVFNIQNEAKTKSFFSLRSMGVRYTYYMRSDNFKAGSVTFELNFEL